MKEKIEKAWNQSLSPIENLKKLIGPRIFRAKRISERKKVYKGAVVVLGIDQGPFYNPEYKEFDIYYENHAFSIIMVGVEIKNIMKYAFDLFERRWVRIVW